MPTSRLPLLLGFAIAPLLGAQQRIPTPVRQATLPAGTAPIPVSLRDASRNDRWLGLGPRDVRWSPDGAWIYFRWNLHPASNDLPDADPWFRTDREGTAVEALSARDAEWVPAAEVAWNTQGTAAAWSAGNAVYLWRAGATPATRRLVAFASAPQRVRFSFRQDALLFEVGESLYQYDVGDAGGMRVVATRVTVDPAARTPAAEHLSAEQRAITARVRERERQAALGARLGRERSDAPQAIPVPSGAMVEEIQLAPDGRTLLVRVRSVARNRPVTRYLDYADASGYSRVRDARGKAGEPRDVVTLGRLTIDPAVPADSVSIAWFTVAEAKGEPTLPSPVKWSPDGTRAVVQFVGERWKDWWIAQLDLSGGTTRVLASEHDDGWIGGPPLQPNYVAAGVMEWLPNGDLAFATERTGWSHLARLRPDGSISSLTDGAWEVREGALSRDRSQWVLMGSRDGAFEDHIYMMAATGGPLTRLTATGGRNAGVLSPDGTRLAIIRSDNVSLPDLYVRRVDGGTTASERRVTESGTDEWVRRRLVRPEMVSIPHPDGQPVYAALYRPRKPNAEHAALIHVHGGGYRQFAHKGWSVYGWSGHVGLLNYFLEQGYTVLDFDYRGSAGFGKAYRTDIAMSMGRKDVDGAVAAAKWLVKTQGVDSTRIGMYGVSYGGFMTLMSMFRYPGIFAAGVSRAPVTDWAHYSDEWTSRILGLPQVDSVAYRTSSPIYYAEGLRDHLLIEHGLVDDNVHFQDTARLVQRLIELEKAFDVMYYPTEPHVVETEVSRYDQSGRAAAYFERWLRFVRRE